MRGTACSHHCGGAYFIPFVDTANASGSVTHHLKIERLDDWLGTPTNFDIAVRNQYIRLMERQK